MIKEDWKNMYDELYDLMEEFHDKWRKNNFIYNTDLERNNKRVSEIIKIVVSKIQKNKELVELFFIDETQDYKNHMIYDGFFDESKFNQNMPRIMDIIKSKMN